MEMLRTGLKLSPNHYFKKSEKPFSEVGKCAQKYTFNLNDTMDKPGFKRLHCNKR